MGGDGDAVGETVEVRNEPVRNENIAARRVPRAVAAATSVRASGKSNLISLPNSISPRAGARLGHSRCVEEMR